MPFKNVREVFFIGPHKDKKLAGYPTNYLHITKLTFRNGKQTEFEVRTASSRGSGFAFRGISRDIGTKLTIWPEKVQKVKFIF